MQATPDQASARDSPASADLFAPDELRRLVWLRGVVAAERHLVPPDQPCPGHQACRRLAFALWLRVTHRLSESDQP
jgi:hypothetical protein